MTKDELQAAGDKRAFILDNLYIAFEVVRTFPEDRIDLTFYKMHLKPEFAAQHPALCGSYLCLLGMLTEHAHFQKLGLSLGKLERPSRYMQVEDIDTIQEVYIRQPDGTDVPVTNVSATNVSLDSLFGETAWDILFAPKGCGTFDTEFDPNIRKSNKNKDLLKYRIDRQIKLVNLYPC